MAFVLPTFNLQCDIYRGPWRTRVLSEAFVDCNLAYGRRGQTYEDFLGQGSSPGVAMSLLLPAGTDIRDLSCSAVCDVVEVPSASGRWYISLTVDDIGKGFDNEHRCAVLAKISEPLYGSGDYPGLLWPTPIP